MKTEDQDDDLEGESKIPMEMCTESGHLNYKTTQTCVSEAHVRTNHYGRRIDGLLKRSWQMCKCMARDL